MSTHIVFVSYLLLLYSVCLVNVTLTCSSTPEILPSDRFLLLCAVQTVSLGYVMLLLLVLHVHIPAIVLVDSLMMVLMYMIRDTATVTTCVFLEAPISHFVLPRFFFVFNEDKLLVVGSGQLTGRIVFTPGNITLLGRKELILVHEVWNY